MAYSSLLPLSLCFLFLFHTCSSQLQVYPSSRPVRKRSQQYECQLNRINALKPSRKIQSEAGVTEIWDENDDQFLCAGAEAIRHTIQERGLLLPGYTNGPQLVYVEQGRGYHGAAFSGCPETYESLEYPREGREGSSGDLHQKVLQIREGDIIALPVGITNWWYNNGATPLVLVFFVDTNDANNQLDANYRRFFLAGNPPRQLQGQRGQYEQQGESQEQKSKSIFGGIDVEIIAEALNIDQRLARKLQGEGDTRGIIVRSRAELHILSPQESEDQKEYDSRQGRSNIFEGQGLLNLCTQKLKTNINDPMGADVYNPRAGRLTNVNSLNLPILRYLQLSAQRGVLYKNAMVSPYWNINAHSICYITRGSGRIQIVNDNGQAVFDGQVQRGQIITAPQNFVVVKQAGNEGLEWISFKTSDQAQVSQLAGKISALRSMPEEVLANVYGISREEARKVKYNREEAGVLSPSSRSQY